MWSLCIWSECEWVTTDDQIRVSMTIPLNNIMCIWRTPNLHCYIKKNNNQGYQNKTLLSTQIKDISYGNAIDILHGIFTFKSTKFVIQW